MTFEPEHALHLLIYLATIIACIGLLSWVFTRWGKIALVYPCGLLLYGLAVVIPAVKLAQDPFDIPNMAAYGVFIGGPALLAITAGICRKHKLTVSSNFYFVLALLVVSIAVDAFFVEPHLLETDELTVTSAKVQKPVRIAVLSDIQTDHMGSYERGVLQQVMATKPDLILFPGDYVQCLTIEKQDIEIEKFRKILAETGLKAPLGAYAVRGNTDLFDWPKTFKGLPVTAMDKTTTVDTGPVVVTGLSFDDSFNPAVKVEPQTKFHIVFGHGPDFSLAHPPADLLVAGHTHGGQVRLPVIGPLVTLCRVPRQMAAGMHQIGPGSTLVVSRGIGMERRYAPRLRFLCRPQLIYITLHPAK